MLTMNDLCNTHKITTQTHKLIYFVGFTCTQTSQSLMHITQSKVTHTGAETYNQH